MKVAFKKTMSLKVEPQFKLETKAMEYSAVELKLNRRCFKVDRPNAMAMIDGYYNKGIIRHQCIWLDVIKKDFPMLITLNRTPTRFPLKKSFLENCDPENFDVPHKFIVLLDTEYHIVNSMKTWGILCSNGLFDIWEPIAPYQRFANCRSNPDQFRVQLLRVYEISKEIHPTNVVSVSSRIDHLTASDKRVIIQRPIISDEEFCSIKKLLEESIKEHVISLSN